MSSTYTYPTIKSDTVTTRTATAGSHTSTLQTMFPATPGLVSEGLTTSDPATYKQEALALLLDGQVTENPQVGPVYNRDYAANGAPDYAGGAGAVPAEGPAPASSWVPNPTSPGAGSVNPSDQPAAPAGFGRTPTNGAHAGSSVDVTAASRNPAVASSNMSTRPAAGNTLGQSPATQNAS